MELSFENGSLIAHIYGETMETCEKIAHASDQQCEIHEVDQENFKYAVIWKGSEAIDFLAKQNKYIEYLQPSHPSSLITKYNLMSPDAVAPVKAHTSDSGWDLTIVRLDKTKGNVQFFSTDVSIEPPHGYYFDLVPRSSLSKTGYILANSVGIIDQSYRGPVIAALIKIDQSAPDMTLPNKCVQLILRPWYHSMMIESTLSNTIRNDGGFGSTN